MVRNIKIKLLLEKHMDNLTIVHKMIRKVKCFI